MGTPIVLLHGWPASADMWEYQANALVEQGFRVIAYDRRGFGRSDQPGAGYDYDTFAVDLDTVLEERDVTDAVLVGFSMAGGEVVRYLSRYGSARVRKAVLVSAVVPFLLKTDDNPEGVPKSVFDGIETALREDRPAFLRGFAKNFFGVSALSHPVSNDILDWMHHLALQASLRSTLGAAAAFAGTDFRADLSRISVPLLIIHGDADAIVPIDASSARTAKLVPGAEYKVYEGAPHGLFVTEKDRLTADLVAFAHG